MLFSSSIFLFGFLPVALIGYYLLFRKSRKLQNIFLTFCSLFFYAWGEPAFVLIMLASIFANWAFALLINKWQESKAKQKAVLTAMVTFNLSILFVFKYLTFTLENVNAIFNLNKSVVQITLPIGISFFTFQAISYVVDIYRKKGEVQKNPINVALYISFFPQLIAGPIVRYETIADQIINRKETAKDFYEGVCRFIIGLNKKILLSNTMAVIADKAFEFSANDDISVAFAWFGAIAYTLQIFFDFSGYSDMAIGLGKMFGFHFLENFDYPYISKSISEFWRRWHISLGSWFRDYVYFPLGGSRVNSKARLVFNLFVVWFLTGLWHGANWTFIVWGLMYFVLITIEKLTGLDKKIGWLGHVYTLLFVIIGWVIFRAESLPNAVTYLSNMVGIGTNAIVDDISLYYLKTNLVFILPAVLFSMPLAKRFSQKYSTKKWFIALYPITQILTTIVSIAYIVKGTYNPFIYFNF